MGTIQNPTRFVGREAELAQLDTLRVPRHGGQAQLVLLYGRRRVGKTVLARRWAAASGLPTLYCGFERESAPLQRRKLAARLYQLPLARAPAFEAWSELWTALAQAVGQQRTIVILDEITYADEVDTAFLTSIQHAWDHELRGTGLILILCGSHVRAMEALESRGAPLYGRFTARLHLLPLPYRLLRAFVPNWSAEERVAAYSIWGGVPGYLEWLNPRLSLSENLRDALTPPTGLFIAEPQVLLADEFHNARTYRTVLKALGEGAHSLSEISAHALIPKTHLPEYLDKLQELYLVERRLPITVPPRRQAISRVGRYHIADPFLHFYFRFVVPQLDELEGSPKEMLDSVTRGMRAHIGAGGFERLSRQWLRQASDAGQLPFAAEHVGAAWNRNAQVDAVAINWAQRQLLLGECKWTVDALPREVVAELIERKAPLIQTMLPNGGQGWTITFAAFARAGLTPAARALLRQHGGLDVDLKQLDRDLGR